MCVRLLQISVYVFDSEDETTSHEYEVESNFYPLLKSFHKLLYGNTRYIKKYFLQDVNSIALPIKSREEVRRD